MLINSDTRHTSRLSRPGRAVKTTDTVHCAIFALDISGFGAYPDEMHTHLRAALYEIAETACNDAGLDWRACYSEDRGDGLMVIALGYLGADIILDSVAAHIYAGLRRYNQRSSEQAQIRLRMAVHAGYVLFDEHGVAGQCITHLFRLLNAGELNDALAIASAPFVVAASDDLYHGVIRHGPGLIDPDTYQPIMINSKETHARAWLWLPPRNHPATLSEPASFTLSREEIEVAQLLIFGWSREKIADELQLPRETVDKHIIRTLAALASASHKIE